MQGIWPISFVELKTLRAKVLMEDRSTVTLDARTGLFDSKQQLLDLLREISSCNPPRAMKASFRCCRFRL